VPIQRRIIRYTGQSTAGASNPDVISRACLLAQLYAFPGVTAADTNTVKSVPMMDTVRIKSLTVYVNQGGAFVFEWLSDLGPGQVLTQHNVSTVVLKNVMRPPRNSRAAMWSTLNSLAATLNEPLFSFFETNATSGNLIIDLELEYTAFDRTGAYITFTSSGSVTVPPGMYANHLDCIADSRGFGGGNNYVPEGVPLLTSSSGSPVGIATVVINQGTPV